jgi:hypothetical protein
MLDGEEAAHLGERDPIVGRQLNQPEPGKARSRRLIMSVSAPTETLSSSTDIC